MDGPPPPLHCELGPCLLWVGTRTKMGYGQIMLKGLPRGYVHRAVWEAANGPIPSGREIHHVCEVTSCARLSHLRCVTHRENMLATPNNCAAQHAARVVCGACGGPYDHIDHKGARTCRACQRRKASEFRARKRAAGWTQPDATRKWYPPEA